MPSLTLAELPPPPPGRTGWPWTEEGEQLPDTMPDGSPWPKVSIVTPSYNQGQFIEETIRSVLLQGYPDLEYIIIDGGSTDGSVDIIRKYERWLTYWVSEPDRGQSHAINKGLTHTRGAIHSWLNSDDFLLPGALPRVARASQHHPDAAAWVGDCYRVAPDRRILSKVKPRGLRAEDLAAWGQRGHFYQPSCFLRGSIWSEIGLLDETLAYAMDLDLWLRVAAAGDFVLIDDLIAAAYVHGEAKTQARRLQMHAETIAVQVRHGYLDAAVERLSGLLQSPSVGHRIAGAVQRIPRTMGRRLGFLRPSHPLFLRIPSHQASGEEEGGG